MQDYPDRQVAALIAARVPRDLRRLPRLAQAAQTTDPVPGCQPDWDQALSRHMELLERSQARALLRLIDHDPPP